MYNSSDLWSVLRDDLETGVRRVVISVDSEYSYLQEQMSFVCDEYRAE